MKGRGNRREKSNSPTSLKQNGCHGKTASRIDPYLETLPSKCTVTGEDSNIFPRFSPWVVCAVTMAVRVHYVCQPRNWWILHPDEIFQTLEVAHSEVYGYGFRSHEYLSDPGDGLGSQMRQSEVQMGMYSMRSFLLPRFYILVSWLAGSLGYHGQPFLLWKVAHVVVSSCLPLAVYKFSKTLFRSHDIAVMAAILVSSSTQLTVFGTHTLINSFIATPLFLALAVFYEHITNDDKPQEETKSNVTHVCLNSTKHRNPIFSFSFSCIAKLGKQLSAKVSIHGSTNTCHHTPEMIYTDPLHLYSGERDANMNIVDRKQVPRTSVTDPAVRSLTYTRSALFLAAVIITTCCYVRVDSSLFVLVTSLCFITRKWFKLDKMAFSILGSIVGVIVCIFDDFKSYGVGVVTPYYWFQFNVLRDFSTAVYGRMDWSWYTSPMFLENPSVACLSVLTLFTYVCLKLKTLPGIERRRYLCSLKLCVAILFLLIIYSTKGHKEHRFLYNILVLLFIVFSHSIYVIATAIANQSRYPSQYVVVSLLFIFGLSQWCVFPSSQDQSLKSWTYVKDTQSHDVITCFDYISRQNDVTGVFSDSMVHMSGGYTVLHKNVPILSLVHYEFYEFDAKARTSVPSVDLFRRKRDIAVSTFTETSEFVSIHSSSYLLKLIISRKQYNYIVFNTQKQFLPYGVSEVFRSGTKRVLKWNPDEHQARQLDLLASSIPLGTNATVLTYEADWLIKFKQYSLARERLIKVLELKPGFLEAYKLLALCYSLSGDTRSSGVVMGQCMKIHNKQSCYQPTEKIYLHSAYKFNIEDK